MSEIHQAHSLVPLWELRYLLFISHTFFSCLFYISSRFRNSLPHILTIASQAHRCDVVPPFNVCPIQNVKHDPVSVTKLGDSIVESKQNNGHPWESSAKMFRWNTLQHFWLFCVGGILFKPFHSVETAPTTKFMRKEAIPGYADSLKSFSCLTHYNFFLERLELNSQA